MSNNLKKFITSLKDKTKRKETGLFIAEGYKLCNELYESNYSTELVVIAGNANEKTRALAKKFFERGVEVYSARRSQFESICETETPQDILAVAKSPTESLRISYPFLVLDGVSDPGNLGTIIRIADWFGVNSIVASKDCVEKYNPKVIRASMGSFFRVDVFYVEKLSNFLTERKKEAKIFVATLRANNQLNTLEFPQNSIFVFGNEARGVRKEILELADEQFTIEGAGNAESLNVAISVGIVLYKYFLLSK
ncbi:MAG: RNA methyltransferase [Ignavibacteria bacterium]|nr:RNA methyltransferase [Ignavibacteria bacterium]